jgi:hypothetical protein
MPTKTPIEQTFSEWLASKRLVFLSGAVDAVPSLGADRRFIVVKEPVGQPEIATRFDLWRAGRELLITDARPAAGL